MIAVSCIYNEGDILESFCRYHASIFDVLMVYDRGCEDGSREIIHNLIAEGLPIHLITALQPHPVAKTYKGALIELAFKTYSPNVVFPLDPDEFLYHIDGSNPRNELERLSQEKEYQVFWRTAIFERAPNNNEEFVPSSYTSFRSPEFEKFAKPIVTNNLYRKYGATVGRKVHQLDYPDNPRKDKVETAPHPSLLLAHYPVRSAQQMLMKIVPARIDHKYKSDHPGLGFHQGLIYDIIRQKGMLAPNDLRRLCLEYALETHAIPDDIPCYDAKLETGFIKNPRLRYTNQMYEDRMAVSMKVLLNHIEKVTDQYKADLAKQGALTRKTIKIMKKALRVFIPR